MPFLKFFHISLDINLELMGLMSISRSEISCTLQVLSPAEWNDLKENPFHHKSSLLAEQKHQSLSHE